MRACPACACRPSRCALAVRRPAGPPARRHWASTPTTSSPPCWAAASTNWPRCGRPVFLATTSHRHPTRPPPLFKGASMTTTLRLGVSADEQALADAVAKFARAELAPRAQALDEQELSVTCHLPQLAELGVMGLNLPEHLGGPGVTPTAMLLALVEISKACAATSSMIGAHYLGTDAVLIG